jgi:hypothetical protein
LVLLVKEAADQVQRDRIGELGGSNFDDRVYLAESTSIAEGDVEAAEAGWTSPAPLSGRWRRRRDSVWRPSAWC